jgi:hypothetical protein
MLYSYYFNLFYLILFKIVNMSSRKGDLKFKNLEVELIMTLSMLNLVKLNLILILFKGLNLNK